jgi:glycosyltransferase involved in cell wall biosynthesis
MNLLFISLMEGMPWGGSEELWSDVALYALEKGNTVHVSVKRFSTISEKLKLLIQNGAKVNFRFDYSKYLIIKALRIIFKFKNDTGYWKLIYNKKYNHILISFGGAYDIHHYKVLQKIIIDQKIKYSIIQQYNAENSFLKDSDRNELKEFYQNASNVFFVSHRNKITTERNLVTNLLNSKIVSNPAKTSKFINENISFPSIEYLHFACVARFDTNIKNQDMLIQIFSSDKWKNRKFRLNLYGSGPGLEYLNELISFYNLEEKVKIIGYESDICQVWMRNHCLILPSSSEGSPLSIIEAMYCSRPIIATNVGGNNELFDKNCGFLIPGVDIISIEKTLEEVWLNKNRLEIMGQNSFNLINKIHDKFSHQVIFQLITKA